MGAQLRPEAPPALPSRRAHARPARVSSPTAECADGAVDDVAGTSPGQSTTSST